MGYRHRFATISKDVYDVVKDMNPAALKEWVLQNQPEGWYDEEDGNGWFNHYLVLGQTEIFDFGKDCWFADDLIQRTKPLFNNHETAEAMELISLCTKADFEFVIEEIRKHIYQYFKECFDTYSPYQMKHHFQEKAEEWGDMTDILGINGFEPKDATIINAQHRPYNMDLNKEKLVSSCLYEYEIFELVLLYRTFNWENTVLMFYSW